MWIHKRKAARASLTTQVDIAKHLGVSQASVSSWCRGAAKQRVTQALALRDLCGIALEDWDRPAKADDMREVA